MLRAADAFHTEAGRYAGAQDDHESVCADGNMLIAICCVGLRSHPLRQQ